MSKLISVWIVGFGFSNAAPALAGDQSLFEFLK